ncbi:response regulator transcription factor [Nitrincola sp. MINF-07-Sa-05]|uniref:response regulator transcription factor n=1 Tax=Nitrincola salilacus TaxID=3400273 RepID=UPI0039180D20
MKRISEKDSGWQKSLASLIDQTRLRTFPKALEAFLATQCNFDTLLIVTYKQDCKPIILHPTDPAEQSQTLHCYIKQTYVLDPLYNTIMSGSISDVSRLSDIAPDSFEMTEYYQKCYQNFGLVDEINLVIQLENDITCSLSLGRRALLGSITRAEMQRLQDIYPIINSLMRQFWLSQHQEYVQYEKAEGAIRQALNTFGSGILTRREQEITGLILRGHSSQAIADRLHISLGTVKVHRKNIHSRFHTSTQSELFTLFLSHLNELEPASSARVAVQHH